MENKSHTKMKIMKDSNKVGTMPGMDKAGMDKMMRKHEKDMKQMQRKGM